MDIAEFVKARLDEDEAAANPTVCGCLDANHIPYCTPKPHLDRPRREVAFKRAILAMHQPMLFWGNNPPPLRDRTPENAVSSYCDCQCPDGVIEGTYPCDTARLLAAVYSDHPDYRDEWAD